MSENSQDEQMHDEQKHYAPPKTFDKSSDVRFVPKSMYYDMLNSEKLANT